LIALCRPVHTLLKGGRTLVSGGVETTIRGKTNGGGNGEIKRFSRKMGGPKTGVEKEELFVAKTMFKLLMVD